MPPKHELVDDEPVIQSSKRQGIADRELVARFETFRVETASQMADMQSSIQQIGRALGCTNEPSALRNHTKPQPNTGSTDRHGRRLPIPQAFYFLKDQFTFFITSDLPFRLPPCNPQPQMKSRVSHVCSLPVGIILECTHVGLDEGKDKKYRQAGRIARAIFRRCTALETNPKADLLVKYTTPQDNLIAKHEVHHWYDDEELQDLGLKCLERYEAAKRDEQSRARTAHQEWEQKRRDWEWKAFCFARQHYTKINWSDNAQYHTVVAAKKSTSLLDKPRHHVTD